MSLIVTSFKGEDKVIKLTGKYGDRSGHQIVLLPSKDLARFKEVIAKLLRVSVDNVVIILLCNCSF